MSLVYPILFKIPLDNSCIDEVNLNEGFLAMLHQGRGWGD